MVRILAMLWAAPWTLLGLAIGLLMRATGGRVQRKGHVIEFWGGWIPLPGRFSAITFGHTILARNLALLEASREHERVHVRQYERWGLLFIPAYLACSFVQHLRGKQAYRDNPFERQAYEEGG